MISVSTLSRSASNPSSDFTCLFCHSKENGFVTTHTVSAPISLAIEATTGAAHVPVHPPSPQVTNTISAPSTAAFISSLDSSAAFFHISGFEPAPSPLVVAFPILSFFGASELKSACASVFTAMNSTPSSPTSIIRFTAFCPAHPTPITFIFATGDIFSLIFTSCGPLDCFPLESKLFSLSSAMIILVNCYFFILKFFMNFTSEASIHPKFNRNDLFSPRYLFANMKVHITEANELSFTGMSENKSFSSGLPRIDGSLNCAFDISRNHFIFPTHHTYTAHSGSIPSRPIYLSSLLMKLSSSSTRAVTICDK